MKRSAFQTNCGDEMYPTRFSYFQSN